MAECKDYKGMISGYVDGELSEQEQKELLSHLDGCASCRALLSVYQHVAEGLADSVADVPDGFTLTVMDKIKELPRALPVRSPLKKWRPVILSFAAAAACFALILLVSPQLFGLGGTGPEYSMMTADSATLEAAEADMPDSAKISGDLAGTPEAGGAGTDGGETYSISAEGTDTAAESAPSGSQMMLAPSVTSGQAGDAAIPASEAPASPTPAPAAGAPRYAADDQTLRDYYAVFTIEGPLPDLLADTEKTANQDGTYSLVIDTETAKQLIQNGYTAIMGNEKAKTALVYFSAE